MTYKLTAHQAAAQYVRSKNRRDECARAMERARIEGDREERNIAEAEKVLLASVDEDTPLRVFDCTEKDPQGFPPPPAVVVVQHSKNGATITVTKPEAASR